MATIGDVTIRIGATTRQLESDLKRAERSLAATGKKFSDLGAKMSLNLSLPIAAIGAASFKMASDVEESLNKVRVAFGSSSTEVEAFASTTLESFGIAKGTALEMAGLFGNMATSMGIPQDEAAKLSTSLVGLAGDLASFNNVPLDQVQTALNSIFTGEAEPLRRFGINMLESNLASFALSQGITKTIKTMSEAEKIALRYSFVLNNTKNSQGDFARTSGSASNQMRIFQESLKEVGAQFGSVLLPILTPVIKAFNTLLKGLSSLTETQKNFIVGLLAVTATLGPLISLVGSLYNSYGKAATAIIKLGIVTTTTGTAAEVTAFSFRKLVASLGPIALGIAAVSAAIALVTYSLGKNEEQQNKVSQAQDKAAEIVATEGAQIKRLISVINDEKAAKDKKKESLNKLIELQPQYFKGLTIEKDGITKINEQYRQYVNNLQLKANAQAADEFVLENARQRLKLEKELVNVQKTLNIQKANQKKIDQLPEDVESRRSKKTENLAILGLEKEEKLIKSRIELINQSDEELAKFIKSYEDLIKVTDKPTIDETLAKAIKSLDQELIKLGRRFKADLITGAEFSSGKLDILRKKMTTLIEAGVKPTSKSIVELKNQIDEIAGVTVFEFNIKNAEIFNEEISDLDLQLAKLKNTFSFGLIDKEAFKEQQITILKNELQELAEKGLDPTNVEVVKLKESLSKLVGPQFKFKNELPDDESVNIMSDLNKQIAIIQDKTKAGFITNAQADLEKIDTLKQALQNLIQAGLGGTQIAENLKKLIENSGGTLKSAANTIFDKLGQEFGPKVKELAEGIASAIGSVFNTLGTIYDVQGQKLDEYEKKQRAAIESGYYSEEQKKKAIEKLEEDLAKKRSVLAKKRAIADKASAIFSATVNGANAVVQALNAPFGLGIPLAAIVGGLVAAQIAAIASAPLPSLAIGTDRVKSDGMAYLHKGEAVVPANVVQGGFTGGANGTQVYGRLSGIDLLLSNRYAGGYYNRLR